MEPMTRRSADIAPIKIDSGSYRRTLGWGDRTLLSEVTLDAGGVVPRHSHPHEQIGYVARGAIEFTIGDEAKVLRAGDGYVIPGGVPHSCLALEESIAVDVFAPVRDEYIPG
jgi:quercetin dioxygenase-like cupin family protein